nr:hypothetical protein [Pseudomonas sp. A-RE-19]
MGKDATVAATALGDALRQALLIIDVQPSFAPPQWLIDGIQTLIGTLPGVVAIERHDESKTSFQKQLGRHPAPDDDSLIPADRVFIKYGYAPSPETIEYLKSLKVARVLVCGFGSITSSTRWR